MPLIDPPRGALAKRPVALNPIDTAGPPVLLEDNGPPGILAFFDVARDGRLLMMRRTGGDTRSSPRLVLVQNWRVALGL